MPEYVVLENRTVVLPSAEVLPHDLGEAGSEDLLVGAKTSLTWVPVLNQRAEEGPDGEVRVFDAESPDDAIDAYAQDENGQLVRPGTYRAISLRNWGDPVTLRAKTITERVRG